METANIDTWNRHYLRPESKQSYPDENLVRLIRSLPARDTASSSPSDDSTSASRVQSGQARTDSSPAGDTVLRALDFGCGSGRHIPLLLESGYRVQGCDSSENAIVHCKATYPEAEFFRCAGDSAESLLSRERYSLIVCWGVLHYLTEENARELLSALCASLIPGGFLLGTLRKDSDTQFTHSAVGDSGIRLSNETELVRFLESQFTDYQYGFMERTPLGKTQQIIAHWFFRARKPAK